jgi:hypothetical protein
MAVDSRHLLDRLEEMAFEEQRAIRAEVDAAFFKPGWQQQPDLDLRKRGRDRCRSASGHGQDRG